METKIPFYVIRMLMILFFFAGCTNHIEAQSIPTNEVKIHPTVSPSLSPSLSHTNTATVTLQPKYPVETSCVFVESRWQEINTKNVLVVHQSSPITLNTVAVDFDKNEKRVLNEQGERFIYPTISPNGKWMFYERVDDKTGNINFQLLPSDFLTRHTIAMNINSVHNMFWQNDSNILISVAGNNNFIVLDPFTIELHDLLFNLSDIAMNDTWQWEVSGRTLYNNDFSYVVYPTFNEKYPSAGYIIWNLKSKNFSAFIPGDVYNSPKWSPRENKLAIAFSVAKSKQEQAQSWQEELFIVDTYGTLTQQTNISNMFPNDDIANLIWSPDGRYIAFWVLPDKEDATSSHLFLFDTETNKTVDLCLPGKQNANNAKDSDFNYSLLSAPKWSPDGQFLAFSTLTNDGFIQILVLDVRGKKAYQVEKGWMQPVGWMTKEP